jgi:ZIP family zinc transporter
MDGIVQGVAVGCVGLAALTAGGVWAAVKPPTGRSKSLVQHLAAGTVFAGLVVDVFRRLLNGKPHALWLIAGLILGLAAMMLIRAKGQSASGSTLGFTIVADVITDGLLMGLSILSGGATGYLFVACLVPEMTLLGVTVAEELGGEDASRLRKVSVPALVGCGVVAGGALGAWASSGPQALSTLIEAFGGIAISYLVMEELLREAHEQPDSTFLAMSFFLGFIPLFVAGVLLG